MVAKKVSKKVGKAASKRKPAPPAKPEPPAEDTPAADGLTTKQRLFVESYLSNGFNATAAAREAGYEGNDNVLGVTGYANLRNPKIAAIVSERINEAAMPANEVMARLTAIGRGDINDVVDEDGRFDFDKARKAKKTGLLKELKRKTTKKQVDARKDGDDEDAETIETSVVYEEVEFKMYSAVEALKLLGTYHKLWKQAHEHSGPDGQPIPISIIEPVQPS